MKTIPKGGSKPPIIVRETEHARLTSLALAAPGRALDVADELLGELERARIVPDTKFPANAVGLGSTVSYETEAGQARTVTLCYPHEADIAHSMVSIMTPIGVALLGLTPGQAIDWTARDGHVHRLIIRSVEPSSKPHAA